MLVGMDDDRMFAVLDASIADLAGVGVDDLDRPVPACEGWDVSRLLSHVGRVHRWVIGVLEAGPGGDAPVPARRPDDVSPLDWFADGAATLRSSFDAVDLDVVYPTWIGDQQARWWLRRQVQETAVHAWDGRDARGRGDEGLDPDVAVDGIDELLDVFLRLRFDHAAFGAAGESMHLHATDVDGEWLITFESGGVPTVRREHAKGDVAARGTASDLLLFLWSRRRPETLDVFGDATLLTRYQNFATY